MPNGGAQTQANTSNGFSVTVVEFVVIGGTPIANATIWCVVLLEHTKAKMQNVITFVQRVRCVCVGVCVCGAFASSKICVCVELTTDGERRNVCERMNDAKSE